MQGLFLQGLRKDLNSKYCQEIAGVWILFFLNYLDSANGMVLYVVEAKASPSCVKKKLSESSCVLGYHCAVQNWGRLMFMYPAEPWLQGSFWF